MHDRAAGLCPDRHRQELPHPPALLALQRHEEEAVARRDRARLPVGGDPQVAGRVEGDVVRARDRADQACVEAVEVGARVVRRAGDEDDLPGEGQRGGVVAGLGQLDDVAELVVGARVGLVDLRGGAPRVVGERGIHLAGHRVGLDVLRPVHLGGADQVCGQAGVDEHLLDAHAGHLRGAVDDERQPRTGAVVLVVPEAVADELRDVEVALGQQPHVVRLVAPGVAVLRHELVHVVEALVVAHVGDGATILGEPDRGALVLEPTERGVLDGRGVRVVRVDLDDPAEAVHLVRVVGDQEPLVRPLPAAAAAGDAVAGQGAIAVVGAGGVEVLVEVLLARQDRPPGGVSSGAVVERAQDGPPGGVGGRPQHRGAGGRTVHREGGMRVDAPVAGAVLEVGVGRLRTSALDLDDGHAVRRHDDLELLHGEVARRRVVAEHEVVVGVLVVEDEQAVAGAGVAAVAPGEVKIVAVVAGLAPLLLRRLGVEVELRGVAPQRVAPADDRRPVVAVGDDHVVDVGRGRGDHPELVQAPGVGRGRGRVGVGDRDGGEGARGAGLQEPAAGEHRGGDVAEVGVVAGVGHRLGALVPAAVLAGLCAAVGHVGRSGEQRQQAAAGGGRAHGILRVGRAGAEVSPSRPPYLPEPMPRPRFGGRPRSEGATSIR